MVFLAERIEFIHYPMNEANFANLRPWDLKIKLIHQNEQKHFLILKKFYNFVLFFSAHPEKTSEHPQTTKCSGEWIGIGNKCFYFSKDTKNWTGSKIFCSSQGSELAPIDTHGDMVRKGESFQSFQSLSLYKRKIKMAKINTQ